MVFNPEKCSFIILGVDYEIQTILACVNEILKNSQQENVLGITIDKRHHSEI